VTAVVGPPEGADAEPVVVERLGGGFGVLPVPAERVVPLHLDLAVVSHPDRAAGQRQADRADPLPAKRLQGDRAHGLGQAPPFHEGDASADQEMGEVPGERRATRNYPFRLAAQYAAQSSVDKTVVYRVPQPQPDAPFSRLRPR
jgi:hypothetical protein